MDQAYPQMMNRKNEAWSTRTEEPYQQQLKNLKAIQLYRQLLTLSRLIWFIDYSGQLKMEKHEISKSSYNNKKE